MATVSRAGNAAPPPAGGSHLLEVRDLTVSYGTPTHAVDRLDLEVGPGEAVALLGANGAGKSSTLLAVSGLVPATGSVRFDGRELLGRAPELIARAGIIQVPEGRRLFAALSTEENLIVGLQAGAGRDPLFTLDEVYDLFPQLPALRRRGAWTLSGGEQQMVAIGRALLAAPRLVLLDEPSLGLAPRVVQNLYAALRTIAAQVALVLVEQNIGLALDLCHRAYVLATGRVVAQGTHAELPSREELLRTYLAQ